MARALRAEGIAFSYPGSGEGVLFREITLCLSEGEIFCLLGPNGSGKSTLLKCLTGLLKPQAGAVLLAERDVFSLGPSEIARRVGYVPQGLPSIFPFLVQDIVVMGRAAHIGAFSSPSGRDLEIAAEAMDRVGIRHLARRPCTSLSGGEWQLTLIARALTQEPRILLLDEPTSHLDLGNQMRILGVIHALSRAGLAVLMATHFPDHALLIGTRVGVLHRGGLRLQGPPEEVITEANMKTTYGVEVRISEVEGRAGARACVPILTPARAQEQTDPNGEGDREASGALSRQAEGGMSRERER